MPGSHSPSRPSRPKRAQRGRWAVPAALILFAALAATPVIRLALHLAAPRPPASVSGVRLLPAPRELKPVPLAKAATPIQPAEQPAPTAIVNPVSEAAALSAEDTRLRTLEHDSLRIHQPEVISVRGTLPTLLLPARVQADYTIADLIEYGALLLRPQHTALLIDSVFVAGNARLTITTGPQLHALYLDGTSGGFASIVSYGGTIVLRGTASQPLTVMGWDHQLGRPAIDRGEGRSYIRAVGGALKLTDVRASNLGFWSGRTGGVAWTGTSTEPSTGGAAGSTFTDNTYGAFVTRGSGVKFSDDLFEFNQLDGLHIHRHTVGALVTGSSAVRNGGNGFVVDQTTAGTVLRGDVSQHNGGSGFLIDGRPLVGGPSASGSAVTPGSGTKIENSAALGNARTGILLEGGTGTVLQSDAVCAPVTGIAVRYGAAGTIVTGSEVRCSPRAGLSIGPDASNTTISGNTVLGARIGIHVRDAGRVQLDSNVITGATVFGITIQGATSNASGQDNVISGTGFRAVDARADAGKPALLGTRATGWVHHAKVSAVSYLQFHPLAALWLGIFLLVLLGALGSRLRRLPPHPYTVSTRWRPAQAAVPAASYPLPISSGPIAAGAVDRGPADRPGRDRPNGHAPVAAVRPSRDHGHRRMTTMAAEPPRSGRA